MFISLYLLLFVVAAQEGPGTVIAYPGEDIVLLCNISDGSAWSINNSVPISRSSLFFGMQTGYNVSGSNLVVENITLNDVRNGSQYRCVSFQEPPAQDIESDPTFLYIAGKV